LPLFADESCVAEHDVEKCASFFHGINIKLTKCSGITPARRMIANARKLNLQIMLGSMNESSVGTAALAHLLPFVDLADLDGPLLLDEDLAAGLSYDQGNVLLSEGSGLGVQVNL
jgi:L-alanine-DL-glutamate epimerase-like enolase superfamily enzyme